MILVAGATGRVGGAIVRGLLDRGENVRVLVRPGSDYQPLVRAGASPVLGDLKEPASLRRALQSVDVLVSTASAGERGGADTPQTVDLEGNRHLIDAGRAAPVEQLVFVTSMFASEDHPQPLLRAKKATENYLQESGLPFTILAANGFLDVLLPLVIEFPIAQGAPVTLVGEGRRRHSMIAAADVAAFAVACVGRAAALNRRITIGGPEPVSLRQAVEAYARALGRDVPLRTIPPGSPLPLVPPVPGLAEFLSGLLASLESFDSPMEMEEAAREFGIRLTTLEELVRGRAAHLPVAPVRAG